jgi:hypothetical protein
LLHDFESNLRKQFGISKVGGEQLQCTGESRTGSARHGRRRAADVALAASTTFHPATATTVIASRSPAASLAPQLYIKTVTATVAVGFTIAAATVFLSPAKFALPAPPHPSPSRQSLRHHLANLLRLLV